MRKRLWSILLALGLCISLLYTPALLQTAIAVVTPTIPVVEDALATDTAKPVVVIAASTGLQTGYATMAAAFAGIGGGTDDYTVVFTQDYTMTEATDMNAMAANGKSAASLNITSSYSTVSAPGTQSKKQFIINSLTNNNLKYCWILNADAVVHDIDFAVKGACVNMYGCGHDFTMGENITVTNTGNNGRIQLYGGSNTALTADTNLTVLSGTYQYVFGGNYTGVLTGDTNVSVGGTAEIINLYAASQSSAIAANHACKVTVDGTDGATVTVVRGSYAGSGIPASSTVDVYLNNATIRDVEPKTNCLGPTTIHVTGTNTVTGPVTATDLTLETAGSMTVGGALTLGGDLTLAANAQYISRGAGTQTVSGDLNVTGSDAKVTLYKATAAATPVKMTVNGSYTQPGNLLQFAFNNNTGATVAATTGDVLLTFGTAINANAANYTSFFDNVSGTTYNVVKGGSNIQLSTALYGYPTWYVPVVGIDHLFYYNEVGGTSATDGGTHRVYRKYDPNSDNWYPADAAGNLTDSTPLTHSDIDKERPQPDPLHPTEVDVAARATMIRMNALGHYRITATAGTNADGVSPGSESYGSASGLQNTQVNIDGKGTTNASWAILNQTNATCSIYRAYLVMTTTLPGNSSAETAQALLNKPMTLEAPDGTQMQSNGYLPDGFTVAKAGSGGTGLTALTSDTPTILTDYYSGGLGEAMTVTDVTDFIRTHGYGKYYGLDIPTSGNDVDAVIGWRLVVLEQDPSMEYIRKVSLQMGPVSNYAGTTTMEVSLDGYTTPDSGEFGGQVLLIGSDNTGRLPNGGDETASNVYATFYPNSTDTSVSVKLGTNDPATVGLVDRPAGSWSQGFMEVDGVRLPDSQVSHTTPEGGMGIDMSLLNVTNEQNTTWATTGGHNLYLTPSSPAVSISSTKDPRGIGYLDVVGLSADIALPSFETEITHTDLGTPGATGVDILVSNSVVVHATATNVMPTTSLINGSLNTQVQIQLDAKLTNIRPIDGGTDIVAIFHNHDGDSVTDISVTGTYDPVANTITFDFGTTYYDADADEHYPLYNDKDDEMEVHFLADVGPNETLSDPNVNYVNEITVSGKDMYLGHHHAETPRMEYAEDDDSFDTYKNLTRISKTVTGSLGDQMLPFTLTVTPKNPSGGILPEGTVLKYTGGKFAGIDVTAPANGTLTVDENGQISFTLCHGQYIEIENIPTGTVDLWETYRFEESGATITQEVANLGYSASCQDSKDTTPAYVTMTDGKIAGIAIGKNEADHQINVRNTKDISPPTGVNLPSSRVLLPLGVMSALVLGGWIMCGRHRIRRIRGS